MLLLTAKQTRQKWGDKALITYYREKLHMNYQLGPMTAIVRDSSNMTAQLIYARGSKFSTRIKLVMDVQLGDTVKLILHDLIKHNPFE